jgi:3-methyladenine DNA glycosylase AlkC
VYGLDDFELSMSAQYALTQRFTIRGRCSRCWSSSRAIRRSVANNLNDIGKNHSGLLLDTARR